MHDTFKIQYKLDGEGWGDQQPIRAVALGLLALDDLLEKAALVAEGKRRTSKKYRPTKVYGSDYRVGSFEADLILTVASTLTAASAKEIWEILKGALELVKLLTGAIQKGENVRIVNNGNESIIFVGNNNSITVNKTYINCLEAAEPQLKKLGTLFESEGVSSVKVKAGENGDEVNVDRSSGITLINPALYQAVQTPQAVIDSEPPQQIVRAQKILHVEGKEPAVIEPERPALITFDHSIKIKCDIIQVNKAEGTGIAEVLANQSLREGRYNFKLLHDALVGPLVAAMAQRQVDITVVQLGWTFPLPELIISEISES